MLILGVFFLAFSPNTPPFSDVCVRKALALAYDRQKFQELFCQPVYRGGLVPPGMPGHSPDLNLPYDPKQARRLLAEAGYPGGHGFPAVRGLSPQGNSARNAELTRQWREILGVEILLEESELSHLSDWKRNPSLHQLVLSGWRADYPDPDNFLRQSDAVIQLKRMGWHDPAYDTLVDEAARTPDRARRLAMYRQADRLLVAEQCLVMPVWDFKNWDVVKPWVRNFLDNPLGSLFLHKLVIQEH